MVAEAATLASSGCSASSATNSGIQVLPSWQMSGVESPANAVRSFSCAALHGNCWTSTLMPGCVRSKSATSSATTSPSRPIAQKRTVFALSRGAQPATRNSAAARIQPGNEARGTPALLHRGGEPPSLESREREALPQVRILAHDVPDHRAAIVLDHREDGALI